MKNALFTLFACVFAVVSVVCEKGWCGDITVPFATESAAVLPKGVRSLRYTGLTTTIDNQFNNTGQVEGLAASMNKTITWNDLAKAQNTEAAREIRGYLRSKKTDINEPVGDTHGVVNSRVTVSVPVAAIGITEKWTMAVAVPIIYSNVNVDAGWTARSNVTATLEQLSADGKHAKVLENAPKLQNVVATQVETKGYQPLRDQEKTQVGDVSLVAKYQILKTPRYALAVQPRLVVPTGKRADVDNIVDVGGGDGQFDVGASTAADYYFNDKLSLTGSVGYLAQLPARAAVRVPEEPNEITPDKDDNAYMDLGDIYSSALSVRYKFAEVWSIGGGAGLQYKARDTFSGNLYSAARYDLVEYESEQYMTSAIASVGYSTVPLYVAKRFAVPFEASLSGSTVLTGRNVKKNTLAAVELVMFF